MRVDFTLLDELVREYCVYRGIVDAGLADSSGENSTFGSFCSSLFFLFLIF